MISKLKIKIGGHEFEAEGSEEYLDAKFEEFKGLVEKITRALPPEAAARLQAAPADAFAAALKDATGHAPNVPADLSQIFSLDSGTKRLKLHLHIDDSNGKNQQVGDAMLIILHGYKKVFRKDEIGSVAMAKVLKNAVGQNARIDNATGALVSGGFMTRSGTGRATAYRITPKGLVRAEAAIRESLAKMQA